MQKARKISLVVLSCVMLLCCCTLLSACGEYKSVTAMSISNAPTSVSVHDSSIQGSYDEYKEELLKNFSVTLTYADGSTATFTGLEELNKNRIYLNNFNVGKTGTYEVMVYCGKISTTFTMTVV